MNLVQYYSEPTAVLEYDDAPNPSYPQSDRGALTEPDTIEERWRRAVDYRLRRLSAYPRGWDGYASEPPNRAVIAFAQSILNSVMQPRTPAPSIVPMSGGGLQLEWHMGGLDIELAIYRPREAELSVEYADGRPPIEDDPLTSKFDTLSEVLEELS